MLDDSQEAGAEDMEPAESDVVELPGPTTEKVLREAALPAAVLLQLRCR